VFTSLTAPIVHNPQTTPNLYCPTPTAYHDNPMATLPDKLGQWQRLDYLLTQFPHFMADLTLPVLQEDASPRPIYHSLTTHCLDAMDYHPPNLPSTALAIPDGITSTTLRLGDITAYPAGWAGPGRSEVCECLIEHYPVLGNAATDITFALSDLHDIDNACRNLTRVLAPKANSAVATVLTARRKLQAAYGDPSPWVYLLEASPDTAQLLTELEITTQKLLDEAKVNLHSPSQCTRTLTKVADNLVGKSQRRTYQFDETRTLVGIKDYATNRHKGLIDQLVVQFGRLNDSHIVLTLPLYAAQWVVSQNTISGRAPMALLAPTDTPSIIEVAVSLWDPNTTGTLSSLAGCLSVARLV
jgi:hypothetical protein